MEGTDSNLFQITNSYDGIAEGQGSFQYYSLYDSNSRESKDQAW